MPQPNRREDELQALKCIRCDLETIRAHGRRINALIILWALPVPALDLSDVSQLARRVDIAIDAAKERAAA